MQNSSDAGKEADAKGRKWWNSRRLALLMGYHFSQTDEIAQM